MAQATEGRAGAGGLASLALATQAKAGLAKQEAARLAIRSKRAWLPSWAWYLL